MSDSRLRDVLTLGIQDLNDDPTRHPVEDYLSYIALLREWNRAYNLTAITEAEKIISHHILDSLAVLPYIKGEHCLDVGSGAGLPGLILALARLECHWTLLDSNSKKTRFLNQVVMELNLKNVTVVHSRIDDHKAENGYSTLISRAFSSLLNFYEQSQELKAEDGILVAMKGSNPAAEIAEYLQHYPARIPEVIELRNLNKKRHLVIL